MNEEIRTEAAQFLFWEYNNGILFAVYKPGRLGELNEEIRTEAAQFLFWEYVNGILVAVYKPGRLGELWPVHWDDGVAALAQVRLRQSLSYSIGAWTK